MCLAIPGQVIELVDEVNQIAKVDVVGVRRNINVSLLASAAAGPSWNLYRTAPVDARRRYTTSDKGSDQRVQVVQHAALNCLSNPAGVQVGDVRLPAFTGGCPAGRCCPPIRVLLALEPGVLRWWSTLAIILGVLSIPSPQDGQLAGCSVAGRAQARFARAVY